MTGSLQQYLDLLDRFASGDMDVEDFSAGYWSTRFRWRLDHGDADGAIPVEAVPFEHDLLAYTPDLEPEVRLVEDRELRRRAARIRRAVMTRTADPRAELLDEDGVAS